MIVVPCWALLGPGPGPIHLLGPGPRALLGPFICWALLGPLGDSFGPCWAHSFVGPCWGHSFSVISHETWHLVTFCIKLSFFSSKNLLIMPPKSRTLTLLYIFVFKCRFLARRIYWDRPHNPELDTQTAFFCWNFVFYPQEFIDNAPTIQNLTKNQQTPY